MAKAIFKYNGALAPDQHSNLYIKRPEDEAIRQALARVGTECVLVSLIGARQTGKTTLLNWLHAEYAEKEKGWISIKVDLSALSEVEGEIWYQQFNALCCERLQKQGLNISLQDLQTHCQSTYIPPFSARGWTQLLRLACQQLPPGQKLLFSLDEVNSAPRQQWEPFFSNIRAVHQAASSPDDRPEYRRLGMILAGAFVPAHLIDSIEKSPFNVSTKVYTSLVFPEKLKPLFRLLADNGIAVDEDAVKTLYTWTSGLLVHVQRLCEEIVQAKEPKITKMMIDAFAHSIEFDDPYLSHIVKRLQENELLRNRSKKILQQPIKSDRNAEIIATLEVIGVIRHNSITNRWHIVNSLCEQIIQKHFSGEDAQSNSYNWENIRTLLKKGFNVAELRRLCFDKPAFKPVYDELGEEANKGKLIDALISHAEQKSLGETLLAWAEKNNPNRYKIHQPYL